MKRFVNFGFEKKLSVLGLAVFLQTARFKDKNNRWYFTSFTATGSPPIPLVAR